MAGPRDLFGLSPRGKLFMPLPNRPVSQHWRGLRTPQARQHWLGGPAWLSRGFHNCASTCFSMVFLCSNFKHSVHTLGFSRPAAKPRGVTHKVIHSRSGWILGLPQQAGPRSPARLGVSQKQVLLWVCRTMRHWPHNPPSPKIRSCFAPKGNVFVFDHTSRWLAHLAFDSLFRGRIGLDH